ncbi:FAD binding domain-containing protein [bacterium]|nr:FAD binding domain-containing protein [bacterium]
MIRQLEEFLYPQSLAEAVQKKHEYGEAAAPIAGGTEIVPNLPPEIRCLIDLTRLGLDYIEDEAECLRIGATTTMHQLAVSPAVAKLASGVLSSSSCQGWPTEVRNTATLGGNLVGGGPFADSPPALLALDAEVVVARLGGEERVPIQDFFVDYRRTAVGQGILKEIQIPRPAAAARGVFLKFGRSPVDQALVNLAVTMEMDNGLCSKVRIALGAIGRTPQRILEAERALLEKPLESDVIDNVVSIVTELVDPVLDLRASADYRRELAGVLTRRALLQIAS